ncbi:ATP-dependent helicase [Paenibacillus cymbidii]|uniref:ATP-dependent helicase n=1 Tax=Paenibacillus cymbidii TaxID=1639034 RepID=UPI001080F27C|nr:ATP-dependent helicase [Paenibacillus cymbidii]
MAEAERFFARKMSELGVALNEAQQQAVTRTEGPLLLLASPGSGKTTTIIMRIGYLIEEKGIDPARIKAVTFSKASAADMKERFRRFFPQLPQVSFSTIHSMAFEVVRDHFRRTGTLWQLIEGGSEAEEAQPETPKLQKRHLLRGLYQSVVGGAITDDEMDELATFISFVKNKMVPPEKWSQINAGVREAARLLREYERVKLAGSGGKRLIDYDDMLTIAAQAMEQDRELLRKYQARYDYVLTDESQDTSLVQHAIVERLVREHRNLCVVADDDQSIYSWRGAEPAYLLDFRKSYPGAASLLMTRNYRSTRTIVDAANTFIKRNKTRYDKNMTTENPDGPPIVIRTFANYAYQANYLVQEAAGTEQLAEVAVLYRNNASSIALINAFDRAGIPFYMKDADNRFFSHWVVSDVLNFMRMTFTDKRADILEKIHFKLKGYISKAQMAVLGGINNDESVFDNLLRHAPLQDYQVSLLEEVRDTFRQMQGMPPRPAIRVIRERLGYEKAIEGMCERFGFRKEYLIGILNTLEEIADQLESMEQFAARLKHLEAALAAARSRRGQNAVTFSTFHSAKGLEFDHVYMIDLVEGVIPSPDDKGDSALMEEAARLFYVGMTRARSHLELLAYRERDGEKTAESTFVADMKRILAPPLPTGKERGAAGQAAPQPVNSKAFRSPAEVVAGSSVRHRVFGAGVVESVEGDHLEMRFPTAGLKKLSLGKCLEMGLLEPV